MNSLTPIKIPPHVKEILRSPEGDISKQSTNDTRITSVDQLYITDYDFIKCAEEHFDKIYDLVNASRESMKEYRKEISDLNSEIIDMKHKIKMQSDSNNSDVKPGCERLWKIMQMYQPQNEVDTVYLKQQVIHLNRDKQRLHEQIAISKQKIQKMENSIGTYRLYTDFTE